MSAPDAPLQLEAVVHSTEAVKVPVPSAETAGDILVNPERPPVMATVTPLSVAVMFVIVEPLKLSLNRKSSLPPAPVSTNRFPLFSTTSKLTEVPDWVSVTVPNDVAVPHPSERWHEVKVNVSADAMPALASMNPEAKRAAHAPDLIFIARSLVYVLRRNGTKAQCFQRVNGVNT